MYTDSGGRVGVSSTEGKRTERFSEKSLNLENSFKSEKEVLVAEISCSLDDRVL